MLFALIDLYNYNHRKGRYSDEALTAFGLRKAVEAEFPDWQSLSLGHMLFAHTANSRLSWLIMYVTNSVLSHTAMIYGSGVVHDVTTAGVLRHSLFDYFDGQSFIEIRQPLKGTDKEKMRSFMDSTLGHGYNWIGVCFLAFHIAIANHPSFAWRLAADITIVGLLFSGALYALLPASLPFLAGTGLIYALTVLVNRTIRRKAVSRPFELASHEASDA